MAADGAHRYTMQKRFLWIFEMADKSKDPKLEAIESIYEALKKLDDKDRRNVLASALALLGIEQANPVAQSAPSPIQRTSPSASSKPISLVELYNEKEPSTNPEKIALFAYYREKSEGFPRFARDDLRAYFAKARLQPASNYDRDFVEAVKRGWIHEDGSDSYLTTKGVEAVESGYEGASASNKKTRARVTRKKKKKKSGRR